MMVLKFISDMSIQDFPYLLRFDNVAPVVILLLLYLSMFAYVLVSTCSVD